MVTGGLLPSGFRAWTPDDPQRLSGAPCPAGGPTHLRRQAPALPPTCVARGERVGTSAHLGDPQGRALFLFGGAVRSPLMRPKSTPKSLADSSLPRTFTLGGQRDTWVLLIPGGKRGWGPLLYQEIKGGTYPLWNTADLPAKAQVWVGLAPSGGPRGAPTPHLFRLLETPMLLGCSPSSIVTARDARGVFLTWCHLTLTPLPHSRTLWLRWVHLDKPG